MARIALYFSILFLSTLSLTAQTIGSSAMDLIPMNCTFTLIGANSSMSNPLSNSSADGLRLNLIIMPYLKLPDEYSPASASLEGRSGIIGYGASIFTVNNDKASEVSGAISASFDLKTAGIMGIGLETSNLAIRGFESKTAFMAHIAYRLQIGDEWEFNLNMRNINGGKYAGNSLTGVSQAQIGAGLKTSDYLSISADAIIDINRKSGISFAAFSSPAEAISFRLAYRTNPELYDFSTAINYLKSNKIAFGLLLSSEIGAFAKISFDFCLKSLIGIDIY